jgi:pimeloyl-ACP methyl ester carboxylesterase
MTTQTTNPPAAATAAEKPPIVLVHGAFANATVWGHVAARLRAAGHEATAVDLPGRPGAPMEPASVTLDMHRDAVIRVLRALGRPAVLVGHSFAGIVAAAAAEQAPEAVCALVFVAAYLPKNGDSLVSLAQQDPDAKIGPNLRIDHEKAIAVVDYAARA